jgi:hypothetical protein
MFRKKTEEICNKMNEMCKNTEEARVKQVELKNKIKQHS